MPTSKVIDI